VIMRDKRAMTHLSWVLSVAEIKAKTMHVLDAGRVMVYAVTGF